MPDRPDGAAIRDAFLADERTMLVALAAQVDAGRRRGARDRRQARAWVEAVRTERQSQGGIESFLQQYDLSTPEGVLLMCVAEALLRIPDAATADALIRDKLSRGDWDRHLGASDSLLVNASTWGLMLTGKLTRIERDDARDPRAWYARFVARAGEPVVRVAVRQAMKLMAEQFVLGRTIGEALARSRTPSRRALPPFVRHAGRGGGHRRRRRALSRSRTRDAIAAIGAAPTPTRASVFARPSISVKLSALHPRYEYPQRARVLAELVAARARARARRATRSGIGMTIDAEEAERLELSLELFARVRRDAGLAGWDGLGLAVQAYQKRARARRRLRRRRSRARRARASRCASSRARTGTPRSSARRCRASPAIRCSRARRTPTCRTSRARARCSRPATRVYPMFATHNAHTIAWVSARAAALGVTRSSSSACTAWARRSTAQVHRRSGVAVACRVYAPVGGHRDLLPYLVRRLLENGANTSFVNRIGDPRVAIDDLVADPLGPRARMGLRARDADSVAAPTSSRRSGAIPPACRSPTSRRWRRSTTRVARSADML